MFHVHPRKISTADAMYFIQPFPTREEVDVFLWSGMYDAKDVMSSVDDLRVFELDRGVHLLIAHFRATP